jgi:hypothetical protein
VIPSNNRLVPKLKIQSLQVFRGLAALAVVAKHAADSTTAFVADVPAWAMSVLGLGFLGVDFFFVLSGFIIMYAHFADKSRGFAAKKYIFKRLVRVFPAYLPISIALIFLYALMPGFSAVDNRSYSLISSLFLLPADNAPALVVAWTLVHELMFYFVFLLFFISKRLLIYGLFAWAGLILFSQQWPLQVDSWLRYPFSVLNIEFMLGVMAAWFVKSPPAWLKLGSSNQWLAWVVLGLLLILLSVGLIESDKDYFARLICASGLAFVIFGFSIRELRLQSAWPIVFLMMGNASYSIYLVHVPLLSVTQRLAGYVGLSWAQALLFGILCSVCAGYFYYLTVERPALRFFNKYLDKY